VDEFLDILGNAAENEGRPDSWTNTEVYPTAVRSALKSLIEGVVFCVDGVSRIFRNDPEAKRTEAMDGRRPRVIEGLRVLETEDRGDWGGGDPGWTCCAQLAMAVTVLERRRDGEGGIPDGGRGSPWVGRFFCWGGLARKEYGGGGTSLTGIHGTPWA